MRLSYSLIPSASILMRRVYDFTLMRIYTCSIITTCQLYLQNTYSHIELSKLAKFAEMNVKLEDQIKAMKNVCTSEHRQARSIH